MNQDLRTRVERRLARSGQRVTGNRTALVDALASADRPMRIDEILRRRRGLALSSAYRNLGVLERAGVVRRIVTAGDLSRFELVEDLTDHHHHLVCERCGAAYDVPAPSGLERRVHRAMAEAAATRGFRPRGHRLDLLGLCRACSG